jgi:hypothetical protein
MNGIAQKIIANPEAYSIDMLTQGVQNGTVPAYIGIPLIQEKTQALKQNQAMMGGGQQQAQPPIAQQVLTDAQQTNGLEGLPTGLPTEGFAPGGIVAFADGGETDDEEDDEDLMGMGDDEKQLFNIMRNRMASNNEYEEMAGLGALPAGATALRSVEREVSSKVGNAPKQTRSEGITQLTKEGTRAGDLINKIMMKESGGRRFDKNGNLLEGPQTKYGTAKGEMQVIDATARDPGFGIRPARAGDADDLARVGREYFNVMLNRYKDPKVAAIAYNWGPGNTDKWLMAGADPSKLPRETQKYSADMAGGGAVHFQTGGVNNPFSRYASPEMANQIGIIDQQITDAEEEIKQFKNKRPPVGSQEFMGWKQKLNESMARKNALEVGYKNLAEQTGAARPYLGSMMQQATGTGKPPEILKTPPPKPPAAAVAPSKPVQNNAGINVDPSLLDQEDMDRSLAMQRNLAFNTNVAKEPTKAEEPAAVNPMSDYLGEYATYLKERKGEMAKDKETNKYLALLQAGLGMMGGSSRYAGVNIGQGASQGVGAYMAGRKQESADDRALQQGMLGLSRADLYNKMHLADIAGKAEANKNLQTYRNASLAQQLGLKQEEFSISKQKTAALEKAAKAKNAATYGKLYREFDDTQDASIIQADLTKRFGKKWKEDAKATAEYKLLKTQSIAQMMLGGELDNAIKMSTEF